MSRTQPSLDAGLALELGSLTARATLQDPVVRVETSQEGTTVLVIEEGAVRIDLDFPDPGCVRRFHARLGREALVRRDRG